ncbi:MAG: PA0069 family radical SAM protein [Gammaproteobacteria bacterium]|nr:PA0069 family radical SAM protein [Gammaproteobacteria bacterium]MDH5311229.1 PA0069 family radical SAM protein [Gammaproteobacteria bacterium]
MAGQATRGRGAIRYTRGRFEQRAVIPALPPDDVRPQTRLAPMPAKGIISHNRSPDVPFDRSINPYLGCEHGCVYCYARPSHSYLDLSPGLDFETRIFYKPNAVELLRKEWSKPGYTCKPITIGANTDPYQPAERKLGITRALLEAFLEHEHPVSLITKGSLILRDADLLRQLADRNLCSVAVSVPTADDALKRILEPRVPSAASRFRAIAELRALGVPVGLLMAPIIPAVNDREIELILERAAEAGALDAAWILLRLPHELKEIFRDWLAEHMPDRAEHVMSLLRQASGSRDYDNRFNIRQTGRGPYAEMLGQRFRVACRRFGLGSDDDDTPLDCSRFRPPSGRQLTLALG